MDFAGNNIQSRSNTCVIQSCFMSLEKMDEMERPREFQGSFGNKK